MSLLEAPNLPTISTPTKSTQAFPHAYALSIAALPAYYAISASSPTNEILLLDKSDLRSVRTIVSAHEDAITSMRTAYRIGGSNRETVISTGKDAFVRTWDERSGQVALSMSSPGRKHAFLCCDVSPDGFTVAAGSEVSGDDSPIYYFDPRNPSAPLRTHADTHSDDITSLSFLPSTQTQTVLLSTSTDGLVSTSNPAEDDEDEAVIYVGNTNCSLSQAGWIEGSGEAKIWTASDTEEFSAWAGDLGWLHTLDIREPSAHGGRNTWVTDYLITCHSTTSLSSVDSNLGVFVGSNEGDAALLTSADLSLASAPWTLRALWTQAHEGVIRSLLWDEANNILLTGGEDGRLNAWPFPSLGGSEPAYRSRQSGAEEDVEMIAASSEGSGKRKKRAFETLVRGDRGVDQRDGKRTRRE